MTATSQTTRVTGEERTRNIVLTARGLEDSLTVLSIKVNLHSLIQQILVYAGELRAQVRSVIRSETKHIYISKEASGEPSVVDETVITPVAVVRDDATVLEPLHHLPHGAH